MKAAGAERRVAVILNRGSGGGHDSEVAERLLSAFKSAGVVADVARVSGGDEIIAAVQAAVSRRADVIVAAGGDGTVSTVASALVDGDIPLGVLPLGTLNHFARDLGIPVDLDAAIGVVVQGVERKVDVGEVNGRVFINNSSLGLYPDIVRDRERQQKRLGRGKWLALTWATLAAMRRYPFLRVRLTIDGKEHLRRTPFVFIGNNEYRMEGFAIGERTRLDSGSLSLYVAQRPGRMRLLQLVLRALVGRLRQARDFDATRTGGIVIDSGRHRLRVATDGEVTVMSPPLHYRIRPASLRVIAPVIEVEQRPASVSREEGA
jgi:diacylglycerol kinase family enzyme